MLAHVSLQPESALFIYVRDLFHAGRFSSVPIHMALKIFREKKCNALRKEQFFLGLTTYCLQISTYQSVHCILQ